MKQQDLVMLFQDHIGSIRDAVFSIFSKLDCITSDNIELIAQSICDVYTSEALAISARPQMVIKDDIFDHFHDNIEYSNWVRKPKVQSLFKERYPELMRILEIKKQNIVNLVEDILQRFAHDRELLVRKDFPASKKIINLTISSGDSHRKGQRVSFLETEGGKIVYKPHSMLIDSMTYEIANLVNFNLSEDLKIKIPKSVDCGDYGWQEFIQYTPAINRDELAVYYQSLGGVTAFFASLGGHDFHYENLTIARNKAVPIDLETSFGTLRRVHSIDQATDIARIVAQAGTFAGAETLILPPVARSARFDIDLSPITDGRTQESKTMRGVQMDVLDDDIEFSMKSALIVKLSPHEINSDEYHPRNFFNDFSFGYDKVSQAICAESENILNLFDNYLHKIQNRCVIRPTATYAAFLDTSYHPKYLVSRQAREELFARLGPPPGVPAEIGMQASEIEQRELLDGDIPYFTGDVLDKLFSEKVEDADSWDKSVEGFQIAADEMLRRFGSTSISSDVIRYIQHGAFAGIDDEVWDTRAHEEISPFFDLALSDNWSSALHNLSTQARKLVLHDSHSGLASMYMQRVGTDNRVQTVPLNGDYYEGQGVFWLLEQADRRLKNSERSESLKALLRGLIGSLHDVPEKSISGFVGGFSCLRLLPMVRDYLGNDAEEQMLTDLVSQALHAVDEADPDDLNIDYVTGLAGALATLGSMKMPLDGDAKVLRDRMHSLVSLALDEGKLYDTTGVAHGPLGLMLGLVSGGGELNSTKAQELRVQARQRAVEELKNIRREQPAIRQAWCTGVPGISETLVRVLVATGGLEKQDCKLLYELFNECLKDIESLTGPVDMSLCHGVSGALAAWYRIAPYLPDIQITSRIEKEVTRLLQRIASNELEIRGGTRHATSSLNMMLGMSGVVLALNRMESGQKFTSFLSF